MDKEIKDNVVRQILKHEITWILFIIAGVWGFVVQVVLPLNKLQLQVSQVQIDVQERKEMGNAIQLQHDILNTRLTIIETEIKQLLNKIKQ